MKSCLTLLKKFSRLILTIKIKLKYNEEKPKYLKRLVWRLINVTIFRLCRFNSTKWIKIYLLRLFGAKIRQRCNIYNTVDIFAPWNLEVEQGVTIGPNTNIYNKDKVTIRKYTTISQNSFLCTASHDISSFDLPLKLKPIVIERNCWIGANSFVGPGVNMAVGSVLSATSSLFSSTDPMCIYRGNPAIKIRQRIIK